MVTKQLNAYGAIPADSTAGQQHSTPLHEAAFFPLIHVWMI
jgi:hypothetical protein